MVCGFAAIHTTNVFGFPTVNTHRYILRTLARTTATKTKTYPDIAFRQQLNGVFEHKNAGFRQTITEVLEYDDVIYHSAHAL